MKTNIVNSVHYTHTHTRFYKRLYIVILAMCSFLLFIPSTLLAQSYQEQKDSLFQHLDKSKISTGVLYDRVYPWVDLNVAKDSTFQISYPFIKQAWLELYLASYNKETLLSIEEVRDKILTNTLNDNGITLGYVDFEFNSIDTQSFNDGSLYFGDDSLLYDGEGNPYHHHHITYPLVSTQSLHGDYAKIYFDPSIYLSNTNRVIERINITLPNNKNKMFFPNDIDSIFIGDIQDSLILASVDIYFSGSRTPESSSIAWLNGNYTMITYQYNEDKCVEENEFYSGEYLKFKGYDESIETQGFGKYRIFYRKLNDSWDVCADNIVKPVIIIDGFDPGDERRILKRFKNGKTQPGIWDMLKFKDGGDFPVSRHLGDSLRSLGYDVIVLNFPEYPILETGINRDGGADYIERNARVLIKLIQNVNEALVNSGSEEEIVVVGPSMGGQIARYALSYMEKEDFNGTPNMNHNTRLYVSFDSPHLGANIPLSLQRSIYALGYGLNHLDAKDSYNKQLRSKAARQMLIEQMDGLNKTSSFFLNYYSDLYSNGLAGNDGWPVNLRKVALINGVADGNKTGTENVNIFDVEIKPLKVVHIQAKSMPQYQNVSSPFYAKIQGRIMPNSDPTNLQILFATKATFTSHVQNLNTNGSMDVVPGGLYKTGLQLFQQLKDAVDKKGSGTIHKHFVKETHSFIPSISALAFKNRNFNWSDPFYNRNLVCANEIPFDNYFVAEENEEHIFISEKAAAWVLEEIEKGQPDCPTRCKREQPIYNDFAPLCINETRIINHNYDLPYGVNTTWSSESPHALEIVFQNNHMAVVKGINNMLDAKLKYTIHNPCGANIVGVFSIDIGIEPGGLIVYPETPIIIGGTPLVNYAKIEYYRPESNDYYWKLGEAGAWQEALNEHCPFTFTIQSHYDPNLSRVYLKTVNNCGEVIEEAYPWMQSAPLAAKLNLSSIIAYPNPSSGDWNVQFTNLTDRQLFLYDYMGKLVWHSTVTDLNTIIPGQQLTTGVYLLKIQSKSEENTIKLIMQ